MSHDLRDSRITISIHFFQVTAYNKKSIEKLNIKYYQTLFENNYLFNETFPSTNISFHTN